MRVWSGFIWLGKDLLVGSCSTEGMGCLDSLIGCEFLDSAAWSSISLPMKYLQDNAEHI
jgi:hypothetical protein